MKRLAINISDVTSARTLKEMQIDEMNKVYATFEGKNPALLGNKWRNMEGVRFDGERFVGPSGEALDKKTLEALIEKNDPNYQGGVGLATLKRALMTKWAMGATRREVVEAAKKFSEPVLYTLAGLSIAGLREREKDR